MVGADGSGKSAALEAYHAMTARNQRGPLTQLHDRAGRTLLCDHAEFAMGKVGSLPIYVDVYALPGRAEAELARRIVLSGCHGFIFVADSRSFAYRKTRELFEELERYLAGRNRNMESAALVALVTHSDKGKSSSNKIEIMLRKQLKPSNGSSRSSLQGRGSIRIVVAVHLDHVKRGDRRPGAGSELRTKHAAHH